MGLRQLGYVLFVSMVSSVIARWLMVRALEAGEVPMVGLPVVLMVSDVTMVAAVVAMVVKAVWGDRWGSRH